MGADSPTVIVFRHYMRNERGLAESTISTYGHHAKTYLDFLRERGCLPAEAKTAHVAEHIGALRARGVRSASVFCAAMAIRAFHRFLVAKGYTVQDTTEGLEIPKIISRVSEPLSADEVQRLLAAAPPQGVGHLRDRAILELLQAPDVSTYCEVVQNIAKAPPGWLKIRTPEQLRVIGQLRPPQGEDPLHHLDQVIALRKSLAVKSGYTIGTVHKAKGLEFDSVLVANFSASHFGADPLSRKVAYVAISRARKALHISVPGRTPSPLLG